MNTGLLRLFPLITLTSAWLFAGDPAPADASAELKTVLTNLHGQEPVKARASFSISRTQGDAKTAKPDSATASVVVDETPEGLRILWSQDQIRAATATKNPDKALRSAMEALSATNLSSYLNGAPELLRELEHAELTSVKEETWESRPAKLLTFKVNPPLSEKDRKYIKELEATARIWVDAQGVPLAAESRTHVKGRAFILITFEQNESERYRFQLVGDRLVVLQHVKESAGSGGGESGQQTSRAELEIVSS